MNFQIHDILQVPGSSVSEPCVRFRTRETGDRFYLTVEDGGLTVENFFIEDSRRRIQDRKKPFPFVDSDLPTLEVVIAHWKKIAPRFIGLHVKANRRKSRGYSVPHCVNHRTYTFTFPNGRTEVYENIRLPGLLRSGRKPKGKDLPEHLQPVSGPSLDDLLPSQGCRTIDGLPYEQHYKAGRFDWYLRRRSVHVEDEAHVMELSREQTDLTLAVLKGMRDNYEQFRRLLTQEEKR